MRGEVIGRMIILNIFWLDINIKTNAEYHCDKHVVKMLIEYTQMLSTANRLSGLDEGYKIAHVNHPCTIWTRKSYENWCVLFTLVEELQKQYNYRYLKYHKSWQMAKTLHSPNLPRIGVTTPPQCMPDIYKCDNLITAYRNYYIGDKRAFARWTKIDEPKWFNRSGIFLPCKDLISNKDNEYRNW